MSKKTGLRDFTSRILIGIIILMVGLILVACEAQATEQPLEEVAVQLKWLHQSQFTGFYAADQFGYYEEEGINITFIEGGPTVDTRATVLNGEAQFGVAGADELIIDRASNMSVRAIATIYRKSPVVFVAAADSGITQPEDIAGKKVLTGLNAFPTLHAMMARAGISRDAYVVETGPFDVELFESGEFPVWGVYSTGSIRILQEAGHELNIIYPDDYGAHFYNDTIFGTDDFIAANSDLTLRFLRATLRGWRWAIENPDEAGALALEYNPELDVEIQIDQMKASVPLIHTGEDHIGWMQTEIWEDMYEILMEQGLLDEEFDIKEVYTMEFLERVYGGEQ